MQYLRLLGRKMAARKTSGCLCCAVEQLPQGWLQTLTDLGAPESILGTLRYDLGACET